MSARSRFKAMPKGALLRSRFKLPIAVVICLTAALALGGCTAQDNLEMEDQPKTASQYMVDLNDSTGRLDAKLTEFADAVADGKISAMQTKAQEAYAILDEMAALEAPDDISDLKDKYNNAASQLKAALGDYMDLYIEIYDSSETDGFDYSTYSQRIEDVQKQYDDALSALEDADKQAADM